MDIGPLAAGHKHITGCLGLRRNLPKDLVLQLFIRRLVAPSLDVPHNDDFWRLDTGTD